MPTLRQRRTAKKTKEVIEKSLDMTGGAILENVGYAPGIVKNPKMVFESEGFKEALEELGFSLTAADGVVARILRTGKEENQLRASDQIYKRLGGYVAEKHINLNVDIEASPEMKALADKLNELQRSDSSLSAGS